MRFHNELIDDRLDELLHLWQESLSMGPPLTPTELCRDCPELIDELEGAIAQLGTIDQLMFPERNIDTARLTKTYRFKQFSSPFPVIPGYEVIEELGRGGMGIVYHGRQKNLKRPVAIKTLFGGNRWNSNLIDRLRLEANALSQAKHRHVVEIIDIVEAAGGVAIILELVKGENLDVRLKRAAMPPGEAAEMAIVLARTMAFVHQQGLLHRDIKPSNILIDQEGSIKVVDFGVAKELKSIEGLTEQGELLGTPCYMAIEQIPECDMPVDVRTDVYAIGATLYHMLSGRPPFIGVSRVDTLQQVQFQEPVALRVLNPGIPRDLETICARCLEKDPNRRFNNAQELAEELERFRDGIPIRSRPIGMLERIQRACRRRPALAALTVISTAASIVILTLLVINNQNLSSYNREITRKNEDLEKLNDDLDVAATNARASQQLAEKHEKHASKQEQLAKLREGQTKEALYLSNMKRASDALKNGDIRDLSALLESQIPATGDRDLRGFEWWHLYRRSKLVGRPQLTTGHPQYLLTKVPAQDRLAVAGADSVVRIFDDDTSELFHTIPTGQLEVNGVAFSRRDFEVATAGDDGTIVVWDSRTWKERLRFKAHAGKVYHAQFSYDGSKIISCGDDPVIRVFDADTGELLFTLNGHTKPVQSLAFFAIKDLFWSSSNDKTLKLWDLNKQREVTSLDAEASIGAILQRSQHFIVIYGTEKGEIFIQKLNHIHPSLRKRISQLSLIDKIGSLAITEITEKTRLPGGPAEGYLLAVGDASGQIRLWSLNSKYEPIDHEPRAWKAHEGMVYGLAFSKALRLTSAGNDGRVIKWDLAVMSPEPKEFNIGFAQKFSRLPNSDSIVLNSTEDSDEPGFRARWDWKSGLEKERTREIQCLQQSISGNGKLLADILEHGERKKFDRSDELRLFAITGNLDRRLSKRPIAKWAPLKGELQNIRFSPDSKTIAVSRWYQKAEDQIEDDEVWLVTLPSQKLQSNDFMRSLLPTRVSGQLSSLGSANPKVSNSEYLESMLKRVFVGNAFEDDIPLMNKVERIPVLSARDSEFSPDGKYLAIATQKGLVLWSIVERKIIWEKSNSAIQRFLFSPEGMTIATCGSNRLVEILNVSDGSLQFQSTNHRASLRAISFSRDGRLLVTGDRQGTIKFWHIQSKQEVLELEYSNKEIVHFEFSDDGAQLICQLHPHERDSPDKIVVMDGSEIDQRKN